MRSPASALAAAALLLLGSPASAGAAAPLCSSGVFAVAGSPLVPDPAFDVPHDGACEEPPPEDVH